MEKKLKNEHLVLKDRIEAFLADEISGAELKHSTAAFGIYQQRDGAFMTRVRITGGHLALSELRKTADIIKANGIAYGHLSTRQDIQLQGVPPENVYTTIRQCTKNGLPFKGGGGNTFRNILVSADSGIGADSVFDVIPYAKSLTDIIFSWDKAFELPRKIKIGFAACERDEFMAAIQDLGFVAVNVDGKRGFKVYGGGGMGRESAVGVKLFDFIPCEDVPRCALAMTELFYDHGDRENRNKARIRFIVKRLGEEKFIELFKEYFDKFELPVPDYPKWKLDIDSEVNNLKSFPEKDIDDVAYQAWSKLAVSDTCLGDDVVSVKLFVPGGNLTAEQFRKVADLVEFCGCSFVRLTAGMDIILPLVSRLALPEIYSFLKNELVDVDLTLESFKGHLTTCIGATVCKIGVLDSPSMGIAVGAALDEYFKDEIGAKVENALKILDIIKISGCPNSCGAHPAACIGLQGQKKKIDGKLEEVYKIFVKNDCRDFALAESEDNFVVASDVPEKVLELLKQNL